MYFKVTRNNLKKVIVLLSSRIDALSKDETWKNTNLLEELKEYHELMTKGSCVCILGRQEDNHLFVEKVKEYTQWFSDIQRKINKGKQ